jgi:hypothetical protein
MLEERRMEKAAAAAQQRARPTRIAYLSPLKRKRLAD